MLPSRPYRAVHVLTYSMLSPLEVVTTYGMYNWGSTFAISSANSLLSTIITSLSMSVYRHAPEISRVTTSRSTTASITWVIIRLSITIFGNITDSLCINICTGSALDVTVPPSMSKTSVRTVFASSALRFVHGHEEGCTSTCHVRALVLFSWLSHHCHQAVLSLSICCTFAPLWCPQRALWHDPPHQNFPGTTCLYWRTASSMSMSKCALFAPLVWTHWSLAKP